MIKKGTKVRFADSNAAREMHDLMPMFAPAPGTKGTVVDDPRTEAKKKIHPASDTSIWVDWGEESGTMAPYIWAMSERLLTTEPDPVPSLEDLEGPVADAILAMSSNEDAQTILAAAFIMDVMERISKGGGKHGTK